ncbi:MAG: VCBS repeat-containing protein [Planctomycetes bacterium]|nr:VCBS repeat-containing protein [Planctomycetota bacterium]
MRHARAALLSHLGLLLASLRAQEAPSAPEPRFEPAGPAAGIDLPPGEHLFGCGDFDNDGDPDLLVDGHLLFANDSKSGAIRFTNVTAAAGLAAARGPAGCWFDFDLDGNLDFGTTSGEVWLGDGKGHFVDFTKVLGIALPHGSASAIAWGDLDGDGFLDLFGGGNNEYNPPAHFAQSVFLNARRKDGLAKRTKDKELAAVAKMRDVGKELGVDRLAYGRSVVFCDFDWDGDDDVYTGNYHLDANCLWRNDGKKLTEVGVAYGVAGKLDEAMFTVPGSNQKIGFHHGHTIGASWADLDNDGYFDLFVANLAHKYVGKVDPEFQKVLGSEIDVRGYVCDDSNVFRNEGPPAFHFTDQRTAMGIPTKPIGDAKVYRGDELWSNAACGDVDNNGCVDVFCNQVYGTEDYSYDLLFANDGGTFTETHKAAGVQFWGGYGGVLADLDSDGRLDLIVSGADKPGGPAAVHVLANTSPPQDWLGLWLPLQKGQQTIGTKVLLVQEQQVQLRQLATTMGSHTQQNDGRVHFGLGRGGAVQDVIVYWPDGRIQALGKLTGGRYHRVTKTTAPKAALVLDGPKEAKTGAAVTFRCSQDQKGSRYDWDFGGSRLPEATTTAPEMQHTFAQAGTFVVWVRAVRPGGVSAEARLQLEVKDG